MVPNENIKQRMKHATIMQIIQPQEDANDQSIITYYVSLNQEVTKIKAPSTSIPD